MVLTLCVLGATSAACESQATLTCPTMMQSVTFSAAGSCSGPMGGMVTISTQPGLCTIVVAGGESVGLPISGQFSGSAAQTNYDISKGNWYLSVTQGNASEGMVDILCNAPASSVDSSGEITFKCSNMTCQPSDCTGGSCSYTDCTEHLTPMM
jgi:hypothetical protein